MKRLWCYLFHDWFIWCAAPNEPDAAYETVYAYCRTCRKSVEHTRRVR